MDSYKIGTDIDKVNSKKVWLINQITELDGFHLNENLERIIKALREIEDLLR